MAQKKSATSRISLKLVGGAVLVVCLILGLMMAGTEKPKPPATDCGAGAVATAPGPGGWVQPMKKGTYQLTSPFGMRGGAMHQGQDFGSTPGQPIYAAHSGVVDESGPATGFGQWIVIDFDGTDGKKASNVYGHMFPQDLMVKVGQRVAAGQQIAKVGYNGEVDPAGPGGAHLHFEHWVGGTRQRGGHAVDPMTALKGAPDPGSTAAQNVAATAPQGGSSDGTVSADDWNKVAKLESGGNWAIDTGNGYQGGLQFSPTTWTGNRGDQFAPTANKATPAQQMEVANRVLKSQGWGAWPVTSKEAGVTGKKPAPDGAFVKPGADAPAPAAPRAPPTSANVELAAATAPNDQPLPPLPASKGSEAHWQVDTVRLARIISLKFPEVKTIGGWRPYDTYPDHPSGRAADIMIPNPTSPAGIDLGTRIQKFVMDNKKVLHVQYTIWRQRYTDADGSTNIMEDRGGLTANHFDHVHVTMIGGGMPKPGQVYTFNGVLPAAGGQAPSCAQTATAAISGVALKPGVVPANWIAPLMKASTVCAEFTAPVLAAQGFQETGGSYRTDLVSPAGAIGPTQFLPGTWAAAGMDGNGDGIKDPRNVDDAIWSMAHYDCAQLDMAKKGLANGSLKGDPLALALSGYNCGPGGTQAAGGVCPYTETQDYVRQISDRAKTFSAGAPTADATALSAAGTAASPPTRSTP